ncbi:MAG: DUF4493 domain-containing protein [Muribaculaceae bacterium]
MKKVYNILIMMMSLATLMLAGCDDPNYNGESSEEGQLKVSTLSIDVDASETTVTRSTVDVSGFTVRILDAKSGLLKKSWIFSEMPEVITLPVGEYIAEVYNMEVKDAEFDAPYYYAKQSFTISKNLITELNPMTCTLENVRVSVRYSEALKNVMGSDVKVTVEVAAKNSLDFVASETRSGYFRYYENNTTLVASFSGTVEGVFINEEHKIMTDVAPRKHYIITFNYKENPIPDDETGSVSGANFTIDASVTVVNESRNIDIEDDIIDPFDFLTTSMSSVSMSCKASTQAITVKSSAAWTVQSSDESWCTISDVTDTGFTINAAANEASTSRTANVVVTMGSLSKTIKVTQAEYSDVKPAPSFSSETIDLNTYNDARLFGTEGGLQAAQVVISAPNGIKKFEVVINSGTLTADLLKDVGLDTEFDLATGKSPSGTDLTEGLAGLGFPVANGGTTSEGKVYGPVVDETSVTFDITKFIPLLSMYGAAYHDFELTVTDNAGQVGTCVIKFQTF